MQKRNPEILLFSLFALIGILTILYVSMPWGIGLSPDSVTYIRDARDLARQLEFHAIARDAAAPPLYPVLLAVGATFGIEPLNGARWLNAGLFGANIILVGLVIRRYTDSLLGGLLGSLLTLSSVGMLTVHSMAWTEPLFLFTTILGLILLAVYLEEPTRPQALYASAAATALAFLDRYTGAALVTAGTLGIMAFSGEGGRTKVRNAMMFGVLSGGPTGLWVVLSMRDAGGVAGRHIIYHPIAINQFWRALHTFLSWLVPAGIPYTPVGIRYVIERHFLAFMVFGMLTAGTAVMIGLLRRHASGRARSVDVQKSPARLPSLRRLPSLLALYIVIFSGLMVLAKSFTDTDADLGQRGLAPIYISGLILAICVVNNRVGLLSGIRFLTGVAVILAAALVSSYFLQARPWISNAHSEGLGYASKKWLQSPIIQRVRALPPSIGIYTNGPDAVYILTGKRAKILPVKYDLTLTGLKNKDYVAQISGLRNQLEGNRVVLVYIDARMWSTPRLNLPTELELQEALPLRVIDKVSDGTIYGAAP